MYYLLTYYAHSKLHYALLHRSKKMNAEVTEANRKHKQTRCPGVELTSDFSGLSMLRYNCSKVQESTMMMILLKDNIYTTVD